MTTLIEDDSPREALPFDLHIPVGVTLFARLVLRIAIRLAYRPLPLPDSIRCMERSAALYALRALVIVTGWGMRVERFGEPASLPPCRAEAPCGTAHPAAARRR